MNPGLGRRLLTQRNLEQANHWWLALIAAIIESVDRSEAGKEQVDGDLCSTCWQTNLLSLASQGSTLDLDSYCLLFIESRQDGANFHWFYSDVDLTRDAFISSSLYKPGHIVVRRGSLTSCMLMERYDRCMFAGSLVLVCWLQLDEGRGRDLWRLICPFFLCFGIAAKRSRLLQDWWILELFIIVCVGCSPLGLELGHGRSHL